MPIVPPTRVAAQVDRDGSRNDGHQKRSERINPSIGRRTQSILSVIFPLQVRLCLLTLLLFPLSMVPLELQRRIVNSALAQVDIGVLVDLGAVYLAVLLLAGALKYVRNLYLGRVSEGVIRRLRIKVSGVLARDEDPKEFGARVSMIAAETEQLGGFVGEAVAQPLLSAGILLSVASYMLWAEPQVALVAFAFFIPSLLIAPWLQERINRYGKQRTELLRELSQGVVVDESHSEEKRTDGFKDLIGEIYAVRVRLYAVKFFAKFLNNFMGHLGVLAVPVFGGMMVIEGRTDIGVDSGRLRSLGAGGNGSGVGTVSMRHALLGWLRRLCAATPSAATRLVEFPGPPRASGIFC